MQLRRTLFGVLAALLLIVPAAPACDELWVAGQRELWLMNGDEPHLLVWDDKGILHPRWSPDGTLVAYSHEFRFDESGARSEIVVVGTDGATVATLAIPPALQVNEILAVGWRKKGRVFVEAHVNPSTSKYLEWTVNGERLVDEKVGSWFALSPDGRKVAQRAHVPHGALTPYDSAMLLIDGRRVFPATGDESYHRFVGAFAWSPESRQVALLDQDESGRQSLAVIDVRDQAVNRFPLSETLSAKGLSWSAPGVIDIHTEKETWRLNPSNGDIERVSELARKRIEQPPNALRQKVGDDVVLRLEDAFCGR